MTSKTDLTPQQRILSAARDVFAAKGYRGGSLNEISKRSGYTRAGVLHHYPSKEEVLLALLDERDSRLADSGTLSPDASIMEIADLLPDLLQAVAEDRLLVQLSHILSAEAADPTHPAHQWATERQNVQRAELRGAIQRSIERDELPNSVDISALADVIGAVVQGLEEQWLLDPSVDLIAGARTLQRMLIAIAAKYSGGKGGGAVHG